jgi:hypothetical protein
MWVGSEACELLWLRWGQGFEAGFISRQENRGDSGKRNNPSRSGEGS